MNINWFKDQENVVYAETKEFIPNFAKETGISDLKEQIDEFQKNPSPEGKTLHGKRRTSLKLMIPNLVFKETLEMGDHVWVYLGDNYPCYCLY